MSKKQDRSGIPDLPPDELEKWANGLVTFLSSSAVPAEYRDWADRQAERLDAYLAAADDLEQAPEDDVEEEPAPRPRPKPRKQRPPAAREASFWSTQLGKIALGVGTGVVVLAVIFGARAMTERASDSTDVPSVMGNAEFDEARAQELQTLVEQDPQNLDALFELGEMNFQAGHNQEAIDWFSKLVEIDPTDTHALTDIGTAYFNLGQASEAKVWWQKVLDVDPNDVQAHYNMGFVYANAEPRDLNAAIEEWKTVIELDPESQLAQTAKVHVQGLESEAAADSGSVPPQAEPTP